MRQSDYLWLTADQLQRRRLHEHRKLERQWFWFAMALNLAGWGFVLVAALLTH